MKYIYFRHSHTIVIIAFLLLNSSLMAQPSQSSPFRQTVAPHIKKLPQSAQPRISLSTNNGTGQKTTVAPSRLIASSMHQPDGSGSFVAIPSDTANFAYSGTRGGDCSEANPLKYDTMLRKQWDASVSAHIPTLRDIQTFNAQDLPVTHTEQYYSRGGWVNAHLETWIYNTTGKDSVYRQHYWDSAAAAWVNYSRATSSYNSSGLLEKVVEEDLDFNTHAMMLNSRYSFTYNAAGFVTMAQQEYWDATSSSWHITSQDIQSYTSSNLLERSTTLLSINGASLDTEFTMQYYYNAASQLVAIRSRNYGTNEDDSSYISALSPLGMPLINTGYRFDGTNWNPRGRYISTYTASGMLSSETFQPYNIGTFGNYMRDFYFYNSFDQVIRQYHETFYDGAWVPHFSGDVDYHYYYAAYNNTVSYVNKSPEPEISLSPIPANGLLRVSVLFLQPASFNISIINSEGKLVEDWSNKTGGLWQQQVETGSLPAGRYVLSVVSNGISSSRPFIVVH